MLPRAPALGFSLRLAHPTELPEIVSIDEAASGLYEAAGLALGLGGDHPFVTAETARWGRALEQELAHVAVDDENLIAFMILGFVDGEPYLDQLAVHPRAMRRGVGGALLRRAIAWSGLRPLWLTTYSHLPWNRPYYERYGFAVVPEESCEAELKGILEAQRAALPAPEQRVAMVREGQAQVR